MKPSILVLAVLFLASSVSRSFSEAADHDDRPRPNLILIVADDLGYGNLGCYGAQQIQTPYLDRMAREGLRFTRFYAGASLCLPSRCSLMTGLHTGHSRCRVNGGGGKHPPILEEDTTLSRVLQAAGYRTAMIGKWALGDDYLGCVVEHQNIDGSGAIYKHGWNYYFGEPNQTYNHRYYPPQLYRYDPFGWLGAKTPQARLEPVRLDNASSGKSGRQYSHDLLADNALTLIRTLKDEPFFLYVPFTIPHADFVVPELEPYTRDQPWPDGAKVFASMITRMDRDIGRMLDLLAELKIDEKTLVFFTSDNGGLPQHDATFRNNGDLEGYKGSLTEGGLRVPCIARWPGQVRPGRESDELLAFWDFMPTLAELAGIEPPSPIDGISFVPTLLESRPQPRHRYLYFESSDRNRRFYVVRGPNETRSDDEIYAEAHTGVVVPKLK